jgi:hypothetical protein
MPRREYTGRFPCGEPGCREVAFFVYDLKRDYTDAQRRYSETPWRCIRHSRPDEVLSVGNRVRETVLTASKLIRGGRPLSGLFWLAAGSTSGSGFTSGPGFKAFASDFPEGTQIRIRVEVVLPDA